MSICELLDTDYGPMIVPTHDINQTGALRATRKGVHHDRMMLLAGLLDLAPPGRVFVDAGANIGAFTLGIAPHVDDLGWLHAFEPQPVLANMLAGSMALTQRVNIRVHDIALGDSFNSIEVPQFDYGARLNFGSIEFGPEQLEVLTQERRHDPSRLEYARQAPLDAFEFPRIDVMKIDVQRMEIPLLRGAARTLQRCRPILFIEWIDNDRGELARALAAHGYTIAQEVGDDWLCQPK